MLHSFRPAPIRPSLGEEFGPALAPTLSPHGQVPADIDDLLGMLARRAADGDLAARNTLHAAFAPRLDHWIRRAQGSFRRYGADPAIEPQDIAQEAFVVFADLLQAWNGSGSLSAYVIAYFPWRLSNAIRDKSDPRACRSLDAMPSDFLADVTFVADQAISMLEELAAAMTERAGQILLLRIRDRLAWSDIANQLGIDRRTAMRDWRRIRMELRAAIRPAP